MIQQKHDEGAYIKFYPGLPSRFIPTRVGNTIMTNTQLNSFTVHPHTGGEHISSLLPCSSGPVHSHTDREHPKSICLLLKSELTGRILPIILHE